jgi:hypothetical protein
LDDERLKWICRNRPQEQPVERVGPLASQVLGSARVAGPAWKRRLLSLLAEHVGPELLDHAEPVGLRGGTLTFQVAEPAVLYHMRLQWEQRLLQLVRIRLPEAGISAIRFSATFPACR